MSCKACSASEVHAEAVLTGHGADLFAHSPAGPHEERRDEHARIESRLAHERTECRRTSKPATAVDRGGGSCFGDEGHGFSRERSVAMRSARASAVWTVATPAMWKPDWRASAAVTGPMQ